MTDTEISPNKVRSLTQFILGKNTSPDWGVMLEERQYSHPDLYQIWGANKGIADIRIYMLNDKVLFGMLRAPTRRSKYYGNMSLNAVGFHINRHGVFAPDTHSWFTTNLIHPDTLVDLTGKKVPFWDKMCNTAIDAAKVFTIPYHTIDLTVNDKEEAVVIEGEIIDGMALTRKGYDQMLNTIHGHGDMDW